MHAVLDAQGRVFQLARNYGVESKEFRALREWLTVFVPDERELDTVTRSAPMIAAGVPSGSAAPKIRSLSRAKKKSG